MAGQISLPFKFNGFVFTEKLGQGTFAAVYKAFNQVKSILGLVIATLHLYDRVLTTEKW